MVAKIRLTKGIRVAEMTHTHVTVTTNAGGVIVIGIETGWLQVTR